MRAMSAQRIRFGILAARHVMERDRLTPWQVDYLEGCEAAGWTIGDAQRAYDRETWAVLHRERERKANEYEGCYAQHNDGDCYWTACPQLRDKEPSTTGRHCPRDTIDPYGD